MNPFNFLVSLFKNHIPVEQSQFEDASMGLISTWDTLQPDGWLGKLKQWMDKNAWSYLVLAILAPILAKKVGDLIASWVGDQDDDGDVDPADALLAIAQQMKDRQQRG